MIFRFNSLITFKINHLFIAIFRKLGTFLLKQNWKEWRHCFRTVQLVNLLSVEQLNKLTAASDTIEQFQLLLISEPKTFKMKTAVFR